MPDSEIAKYVVSQPEGFSGFLLLIRQRYKGSNHSCQRRTETRHCSNLVNRVDSSCFTDVISQSLYLEVCKEKQPRQFLLVSRIDPYRLFREIIQPQGIFSCRISIRVILRQLLRYLRNDTWNLILLRVNSFYRDQQY